MRYIGLLNYNLSYNFDARLGVYSPREGYSLHHQLRAHNSRGDMHIEHPLDKSYLSGLLSYYGAYHLTPSIRQCALGNFGSYMRAFKELVKQLAYALWFCTLHSYLLQDLAIGHIKKFILGTAI